MPPAPSAALLRRHASRGAALLLAACTACGGSSAGSARYPNDDRLRLEHVQMRGSHNSYHVAGRPFALPTLNYTLPSLDEQLELGLRQFELDIHWAGGAPIRVYHIPYFDLGTTCERFVDCLATLKEWSDAHPDHQPLVVFVEPKDELEPESLVGRDRVVEEEILSVWPPERIVTPDEVRRGYGSLREAILAEGWPTLGELRGRVLFTVFDEGDFRDAYVDPDPTLRGRWLFPRSDLVEPYASFDNLDDPREDADEIREAVLQGFLIRTRSDANTLEAVTGDRGRGEAALASGAQIISTDYPLPAPGAPTDYSFDIADGTPSRCNPVTAPSFCRAEDVERP